MRANSKQLDLYLEFDAPVGLDSFINLAKKTIWRYPIFKSSKMGQTAKSNFRSAFSKNEQGARAKQKIRMNPDCFSNSCGFYLSI